jgi:peptide/nickel transport system ATP-binding protein
VTLPPALEIKDLVVEYLFDSGPVRVLDGVSFTLSAGRALAVVGESGSGKTSLCQALLRLLPAPAVIAGGRVDICGREVTAAGEIELRALRGQQAAFVPQSAMNALSPLRSIGAHLRDAITAHGAGASGPRIADLLTLVGLDPALARAFPHQLSAGMRQRVVIALALAHDPALLILDEPTAALDTISTRALCRQLQQLRDRKGFALLLVTHDLPLALGLCDRVGVLHRGSLVELASSAQLRDHPRHPQAVALVRATQALSLAASPDPDRPSAVGADPVLTVRGLGHEFRSGWGWRRRRHVAVDDVSFEVRPGEAVALVGGSGSGKTTIARILVRRLTPTAGEIWWRGRNVLRDEPIRASLAYRAAVQMVFQDPFAALNPAHTVAHALARPLRRHHRVHGAGELTTRIHQLLEQVGLPADFARRHPHQLSGGQRQRVCVARALAVEPALLIADEPTSMLDVAVRGEILALLDALKRERALAFIYITHDLASARAIADRVLVLCAGKIVDAGPTARVLHAPSHPYTVELLAASRGQ